VTGMDPDEARALLDITKTRLPFEHGAMRYIYRLAEAYLAAEERASAAEQKIAAIESLFAGGPDTPCRTVWRGAEVGSGPFEYVQIECVEVPVADLRAVLGDHVSEDQAEQPFCIGGWIDSPEHRDDCPVHRTVVRRG
jgi:hypothetical protein